MPPSTPLRARRPRTPRSRIGLHRGACDGIRTGAADADDDGYISVDDAYTYAFDEMRAAGAQQTPQRWLYGAEGDIVLAKNPSAVGTTPVGSIPTRRPGSDADRFGSIRSATNWRNLPVESAAVVEARTGGVRRCR